MTKSNNNKHIIFKPKSNLRTLRSKLPNSILHKIYPFLVNTNYKKQFDNVLIFIKYKSKMMSNKRCTPCKRCNIVKTNNKYCKKCEPYNEVD